MVNAEEPKNTPKDAPKPLRALGRYVVSRQLGEGAMGRVYLAHDPELGRDVAVKVLRLEVAGAAKDAFIARFRNEARAAARFNHPNVVSVHDAGVDPVHGPFVVYEFIAGANLRRLLDRGPLERPELLSVARGIAAALDALHGAQIIHRDIKPDNILIAPDGTVKITDFGIARVPDAALTRDGQFLGTPAYAPPEAITKGEYSARGDVWSLAAVLYEAVTGVRPFPGDDAVTVSYAVVHDPVLPPSKVRPEVPAALDAVFERAFSKRVAERYPTAIELANHLTSAMNAGRVAATATATIGPRRPQHPTLVTRGKTPSAPGLGPIIAAAVALVLLVAALLRGRSADPQPAAAVAPSPAPSLAPVARRAAPSEDPAARAEPVRRAVTRRAVLARTGSVTPRPGPRPR